MLAFLVAPRVFRAPEGPAAREARPHHRPPAPRPCPATAHGRCSQASSSAPRPHPEFGPAGRVLLRRREPQTPHNTCRPPRLKPMTPMRVDHCHEMKPLTPLLPQNSQFQAIFRPQRRHRLHAPLAEQPQRRRRFHQMPNQGFWFSGRHSDTHACCLRHNPGSVGA